LVFPHWKYTSTDEAVPIEFNLPKKIADRGKGNANTVVTDGATQVPEVAKV
jgi:hypothetical protein